MKEYISNLIKSEITALDEKAKRDYKAEYKKFQSSTKAKKYRAELNKYNRQKGTYGNGDKKDASHKGGKIVGFESQSKNRGRAEKSRLKKEDLKRLVKTYGVERVLEACQKGYMTHPTRKTKIMFGKRYRNCVKKEDTLPSPSRKLVKKMKKKGNTSVPYGSGYKKVNETPYELGGMKVYSKADGLKKVKSMQKTSGAKIYKVTKTKTKLYGTNPVTMYNLHTKNKNHSTNSNPYGLDMMKGAYLIPVKESINEQYFDPKHEGKKYMDRVLKKAGIRVITFDPMKKSFYNGIWGGFYTVASSNMTDMPGQGKVKRSSAVLPVYIDKKSHIELGVSGKGFKLGPINSPQVLKKLKSFKKSDLEESINEAPVFKYQGPVHKNTREAMKWARTQNFKKDYGVVKVKGGHKVIVQESINERAWTPAQEKAVKELDKKFYKVIGKKGIEPYSYEASQMWTSGGFRKEMRKIFGKDESINEREMSIKDAYKDLVKDHGSKKALDMLADVLTGGALAAMDDKKVKAFKKKLLKKMMKESVNEGVSKSQAQEIMRQLGGRRFEMLMGVKSKGVGKDGFIIHIGRNPKKSSLIIIDLDRGTDLYNIKFGKVFKYKFKVMKNLKGIGVEQMHDVIEKHTGLLTTFRKR